MQSDLVNRYNQLKQKFSNYEKMKAEIAGEKKVYIAAIKKLGYNKLSEAQLSLKTMDEKLLEIEKSLDEKLSNLEKELEGLENG